MKICWIIFLFLQIVEACHYSQCISKRSVDSSCTRGFTLRENGRWRYSACSGELNHHKVQGALRRCILKQLVPAGSIPAAENVNAIDTDRSKPAKLLKK
uniref:Sushi domain-containing protein n=1 Tax=Ciona savignyi TaxID=51511 RepID=H2Z6M1_CIOSA